MEVTDGKKFAAYMQSVRKRTIEVFRTVPNERAHWRLTEDSMSPVDILLHIGATEEALWGAGLRDNGRAVELKEPSGENFDLTSALDYLAERRAHNETYWRALTPDDLGEKILTPTGHHHVLKRWLVLAAEHEVHHRSFLHAYRKLWGMDPHPIYGLTLPQLRENLAKLDNKSASGEPAP